MKIVTIIGLSGSGKTTVAEALIPALRARGYRVGSVKSIHASGFEMDTPGKNTHRHAQAGASVVTALADNQTAVIFREQLPLERVLEIYREQGLDYAVLEGVRGRGYPAILTGRDEQQLCERYEDTVFLVSGVVAEQCKQWRGLPVLNALYGGEAIADMVEQACKI